MVGWGKIVNNIHDGLPEAKRQHEQNNSPGTGHEHPVKALDCYVLLSNRLLLFVFFLGLYDAPY